MNSTTQTSLDALKDIRNMMERSSRFISLSGWSGISAGICALTGAWVAHERISGYFNGQSTTAGCPSCLKTELIIIAFIIFVAAFFLAVSFTFIKSRKNGSFIWSASARRLLWNTLLPMVTGGILIWKMMELKQYDLIVPSTLIFYGLALVNGSKYTMGEVRYLGYAEIITGIVSIFLVQQGIYIWAFGFGILHILYGLIMWWKYDQKTEEIN